MQRFLVLALVVLSQTAASAADRTLFVQPARSSANQDVGNWAVTASGNTTHFPFAIPSDFGTFTEAVVVAIGKQSRAFSWTFGSALLTSIW